MKSWLRFVIVAAALATVPFLLKATVFKPRPIDVEVDRVSRGQVEDAVTNSQAGTVRSRLKTRVGAERAGRVVDIPFREGATVKHGDLVVRLDTSTAETRLLLARKDVDAQSAGADAARAAATLAGQDHERTEQLFERGAVSRGEMDQAQTRLESAEAEFAAARARLERARAAVRLAGDELDHLRINAPFDGIVTQRFIEVGESVVPGQATLEIMSPDSLYVSAPIDEVDIGRIRHGLPARITLDPYPDVAWLGRVTRVAPYVDDQKERNRTLEIEVDMAPDPTKPRPRPGPSADVEIILDARQDVLRVPTFAVIEGERVFVVDGDRAVTRPVSTGLRNWEWTEILDGLAVGEAVITSLDKQGIAPGVRVRVVDDPGDVSSTETSVAGRDEPAPGASP